MTGMESGEFQNLSDRLLEPIEFKQYFDGHLQSFCASRLEMARSIDPDFTELVAMSSDMVMHGGKRGRPYLCHLAYAGLGGNEPDRILSVMQGIELYHNALLIHDDIMDHDSIRHGTLNVIGTYGQKLTPVAGEWAAADTANSMALLAGDLWAGLAFEQLASDDNLDPATRLTLIQRLTRLNYYECAGQQLDSLLQYQQLDQIDLAYLFKLYRYKTAMYSFTFPLQCGAILAGREDLEQVFENIGTPAGIAFQITDDVIGMFGDEEVTGKPVGSDITENKKTILVRLAFERADETDRQMMLHYLGKSSRAPDEIQDMRRIIRQTGAKAEAEKIASSLINEALSYVDGIEDFRVPVRNALDKSFRSIIGRTV